MRYLNLITLSGTLFLSGVLMAPSPGEGQESTQAQTVAQEKAASLRSQLSEVEAKQAELQTRLQQLEENLKSENIEHSLAGVGSTRPEDLREQRRRQLEIERNGVKAQLDILARSHSRLETAIGQADAEAYRESAAPVITPAPPTRASTGGPSGEQTNEATTPVKPQRVRKKKKKKTRRAAATIGPISPIGPIELVPAIRA
jgi:DNA repair exonuclease SbcCD ATPase subunit